MIDLKYYMKNWYEILKETLKNMNKRIEKKMDNIKIKNI